VYIPEWEVEELLTHSPELLGFPSVELTLVERQKYLAGLGGYIDLLFKKGDTYLIVEVKSSIVNDKSVIVDQLLQYKKSFAEETGLPDKKIMCVLASPNGFTDDVRELCQQTGVITRTLDKRRLTKAIKMWNLRVKNPGQACLTGSRNRMSSHVHAQSDDTKSKLARLFAKISNYAPIEAHEVGTANNGKLIANSDAWFWLFYSVMDRRANAATFIKAKEALERVKLFAPLRIVGLLKKEGETAALRKVARVLREASFPLLNDHTNGEFAFPKSIVNAAMFMSKYNYDFERLYSSYVNENAGDLHKARDAIWKDLQKQIYGVGPRIASQVIRGMVMKGPWRFPLDDDRFLEECRFNVWMAGQTRLGLIDNEDKYHEQLGEFADRFLDGNRGLIAHVLWYVRKRYCNRPLKCNECELARHCKRAHPLSS
jgi:hypothetical protein